MKPLAQACTSLEFSNGVENCTRCFEARRLLISTEKFISLRTPQRCVRALAASQLWRKHTAMSQPAMDSYMKLIRSAAAPFPTVHLADFCMEVGEFHLLYRCSWKDFTHKLFPVHNTYSKQHSLIKWYMLQHLKLLCITICNLKGGTDPTSLMKQ